jgi:murein DD-endopeptidase MepM/ murein hydrolase activator NlpD
MMFVTRPLIAVALGVLPGSCIAAAPAPKPSQKPINAADPKPMPPRMIKPQPVAAIGLFALDRQPQQGGLALGRVPAGTKRLVVDGAEVTIAKDGLFVVGFGRDYKGSAIFAAFGPGGEAKTEKVTVQPRAWHIESLPTLPHHSQPDAEFQRRRPAELAQINAARRMVVTSEGWRQRFIRPAQGRVSGFFGSQRVYAGEPGAPHNGVDIAGPAGAQVVAPADGVVILAAASPFTLEGNLLMIDHGMGLNSAFLHLSRIDVKKGDIVRQGQAIGAIGMTGRATGPHLHWGMKWQDERIDPQPLAGM